MKRKIGSYLWLALCLEWNHDFLRRQNLTFSLRQSVYLIFTLSILCNKCPSIPIIFSDRMLYFLDRKHEMEDLSPKFRNNQTISTDTKQGTFCNFPWGLKEINTWGFPVNCLHFFVLLEVWPLSLLTRLEENLPILISKTGWCKTIILILNPQELSGAEISLLSSYCVLSNYNWENNFATTENISLVDTSIYYTCTHWPTNGHCYL